METEAPLRMLRWAHLPECEKPVDDWFVKRFTDVAKVIAGQSPPSETYNEKGDGMPFLQGNADFSFKCPQPSLWCTAPAKNAHVGDTLISVRAPVGEVNRADREYAIGRGLVAIRATDLNPDFIYQALQRWRWCLQRVAQGTTFDAVTARHFSQLHVAVPVRPDEQATIARILDAVDTALEHIREAVTRATALRRSLLTDLLSRGIDCNGRVRNSESEPQKFVKTPLGQLPVAWTLSTVSKEFDLQTGFTLNETRRARFRKRRYLRVANVQRDALDLSDIQELEAGDAELAPRVLKVDDLLVVEGHADNLQIGRCARVTEAAGGMTFQNHLFRLRACGNVTPYFGGLWLNSDYAVRYWKARCATSSGLNTINQRMLKRLMVPVLPKPEQEKINELVACQRKHLEALKIKEQALMTLKTSLMHDLLTGQVRVNPRGLPETILP